MLYQQADDVASILVYELCAQHELQQPYHAAHRAKEHIIFRVHVAFITFTTLLCACVHVLVAHHKLRPKIHTPCIYNDKVLDGERDPQQLTSLH